MTYLPYMADKKYKQRSEEEMNRLKQRNKNILEKVKQWQSFPYVKPMVCRNEKCEECKLKPKETRTRIMLQCPKCKKVQTYVPNIILKTKLSIPGVLVRNKCRYIVND
ncbi:MAG: hypothetical protein DRQ40_00460 [Gammaproteobacteria bacterium]|nr:MAG: hypothetical protein DRQ40_00460 [Gammaproteobacteria bacterium]